MLDMTLIEFITHVVAVSTATLIVFWFMKCLRDIFIILTDIDIKKMKTVDKALFVLIMWALSLVVVSSIILGVSKVITMMCM